jgi:hypothetical protein
MALLEPFFLNNFYVNIKILNYVQNNLIYLLNTEKV